MSFITVRLLDFNTSYVVIKLIINFTRFRCRLISIHLMLLLNLMLAWQMLVFKHFNTSYVVIKLYWRRLGISTILHISIHLMLLLNETKYIKSKPRSNISIHLMLLLNEVAINRPSITSIISIHLMLLLNLMHNNQPYQKYIFQYILCCY